jgi:hypothetical protein
MKKDFSWTLLKGGTGMNRLEGSDGLIGNKLEGGTEV